MKNRNWIIAALMIAAVFAPMNCGCEYVRAGYVGVKVYTLGGDKGSFEVLGVGRHWEGINEDIYLFPTFTQSKVWTADAREDSPIDEHISLQSKEGVIIDADVGMTYAIQADKVVTLFQKYRKDVHQITNVYLRAFVRDALNRYSQLYSTAELYSDAKTKVIEAAEKEVRDIMKDNGIYLERLYWVSALRPPDNITAEINNKVAAIQIAQRKANEVEAARSQAKINELSNSSITEVTLRMKELEIKKIEAERWNGQKPHTIVYGSGSDTRHIHLGKE